RHRLGGPALNWPLIVADSSDRGALDELAGSTTAIATTVGPYAKYGKALVAACAEAGTHYADLTGETLFMRDTIDAYDEPARRSGTRSPTRSARAGRASQICARRCRSRSSDGSRRS